MVLSIKGCPVTGYAEATVIVGGDYTRIICRPLGGEYRLSGTASEQVGSLSPVEKAKLAVWIIDQLRLGAETVMVTSSNLEEITARPRMAVLERVQRLYQFLGRQLSSIGGSTRWVQQKDLDTESLALVTYTRTGARAWSECSDDEELEALVSYGFAQGILMTGRYNEDIALTISGWNYLEQLDKTASRSDRAFVAMWFDPEVSSAYKDGIEPAIRDAGYKPMRIDQKEHANRIDDEIIAEIRRSRFVIADFTCGLALNADEEVVINKRGDPTAIPRGGVYYEAGFAQGLGIPVIWMVRQDHIDYVHFDTRQFNHITWTDAADLREKLKNRIVAVLGDGPHMVS